MSQGKPNFARCLVAVALPIAVAIWMSYTGVNHAVAAHYGESPNGDNWLRAAQIEPANAENWYRLARYRQFDFDHTDLPLAISYYRRAVQLNPRSPYYKLDLAGALELSGEIPDADKYFRAAQDNYPISAEVSWKYGNFLLRQQRMPEAYAEIHRAAVVNPSLASIAVSRAWHSNTDVHVLLDQVLPDTVAADWAAIAFLSDSQEAAAALEVWKHLAAKKPAIESKQFFGFIDMLVKQERYEDAGTVWRQANSFQNGSSSTQKDGSLVFDGGFEKDISGGGFGWKQSDVQGADFDFDSDIKHGGERSARILFDGTQNLNYVFLSQQVLVSPGTHYRFRGYLRTDQIQTDSGLRFEIVDPKDQKNLDILTPNERGTQPWTLEEADFTPGPKTHVILIRVFRAVSQHLDNKIRGTVWVDDIGIFPAGEKP
jgi:tetratricopeptide (TPR) repeat protein